MQTVEEYQKEKKAEEIEANYQAVKEIYTDNGKSYKVSAENLTDIIGLVALNEGSNMAVTENGNTTLVNHTAQDLVDLLNGIRGHFTQIKTTRFNKLQALEALVDHQEIMNFDTTI